MIQLLATSCCQMDPPSHIFRVFINFHLASTERYAKRLRLVKIKYWGFRLRMFWRRRDTGTWHCTFSEKERSPTITPRETKNASISNYDLLGLMT